MCCPRCGREVVLTDGVFSCVASDTPFNAVRSKTDAAMVNEVLCKLLAHNLCVLIQAEHELGIGPVFWAGSAITERAAHQRR